MRSSSEGRMQALLAALAGALALTLPAPGASAQNLAGNQVGAAIAAPYFTGSVEGDVVTSVVVTNALAIDALLQIHVLNGDPDGDWEERSFDCLLTGRETTNFVFSAKPSGSGAEVHVECSTPGVGPGHPPESLSLVNSRSLPGHRGLVFIALKDPTDASKTLITDGLLADWTVVDFASGRAFSAMAIHFQRGQAFDATRTALNADQAFQFDGVEYSPFPSVLASNFIAPDCADPADPATCWNDAELILFTLDGRGDARPPVAFRTDFYNDDERIFDNAVQDFDCFTVLRLLDIDEDFNAPDLCEVAPLGCVGHFVLTPRIVDVFTGHDNPVPNGFGGALGDDERLSVLHGWLVQPIPQYGDPLGEGRRLGSGTGWVRVLNSGPNTNAGIGGDIPALDLR